MKLEFPGDNWTDYELIDCGGYEKLERFGRIVVARPEPKALWDKTLDKAEWDRQVFTRFVPGAGFARAGKEDSGTWTRFRQMPGHWDIKYSGGPTFVLNVGLTSFKHVGVFPEQAPNWEYIFGEVSVLTEAARKAGKPAPKVLNLFAYTGAASLAARAAGADVTHLDSVKQVVNWAANNMQLSHLDNIRWIIDDALKFVRRENRRGNLYQGIILDPPAYGRGPDGERWVLEDQLFDLLKGVAGILAKENSFMVLNLYSNGYSATLGETLVREAFRPSADTRIESGELALKDRFGKVLPLSIFVRMSNVKKIQTKKQ